MEYLSRGPVVPCSSSLRERPPERPASSDSTAGGAGPTSEVPPVIGSVRGELLKRGIRDLETIADEVQHARDVLAEHRLFSADHFTENGVDSRTRVVADGASTGQEC